MFNTALAIQSLTTVPVLAFLLGIVATRLGSDLKLPPQIYTLLTFYLLLSIGLKGGVGLRQAGLATAWLPTLAALALGALMPFIAFGIAKVLLPKLSREDKAALAAHYGSTSLVTFTVALTFLNAAAIAYEPYLATLLAVMEVPALIIAILLAGKGGHEQWSTALKEILLGKSVMLLFGGLAIGFIAGQQNWTKVEPFFGALFQGILTLFLLHMGTIVAKELSHLRTSGIPLVIFAIITPIIGGLLGVLTGTALGLSIGGATVLGTLTASASYIAAPAAVKLAIPKAKPGFYLTASLGVTFPFNLIVGIPLYLLFASKLAG